MDPLIYGNTGIVLKLAALGQDGPFHPEGNDRKVPTWYVGTGSCQIAGEG